MPIKVPRFLRQASIYSLGTILRSAASILLLPVYTRYLSPADYGLVELVTVVTVLVGNIVSFDLNNPIFRYYAEASTPQAKRQLIMSALVLTAIVNLAAAGVLAASSPFVAVHFLGGTHNAYLLAWFSLSLVLEALSAIPFCHMRADGKVGLFMSLSIARLAMQIGLNLLFLIGLKLGAASLIYANLISCAVQSAGALSYTLRGGSWAYSKADIRRLVVFGGPLAIAGLAGIYISSGDRFFLSRLNTLAEVGVYALAYRLSQAVNSLVYLPFLQVWEPEQFRVHAQTDLHAAFALVFRIAFTGLTLIAFSLAMFAPEVLRILATPAFYGAADAVPLLLLAVLFSAMTDFCRLGSLVGSRPFNVTTGAILGALVATAGFVFLIPPFGSRGAAASIAAGTLARLLFEHARARTLFDQKLVWTPIVALLISCAVVYLASRQLAPMQWTTVAVKLLSFVAVLVPSVLLVLRHVRNCPDSMAIVNRLIGRERPARSEA